MLSDNKIIIDVLEKALSKVYADLIKGGCLDSDVKNKKEAKDDES